MNHVSDILCATMNRDRAHIDSHVKILRGAKGPGDRLSPGIALTANLSLPDGQVGA